MKGDEERTAGVRIGLEIHCQLTALKTKLFCPCSSDYRARQPNELVCPVCFGIPGTLPVLNGKGVEYAIRIANALGCKVSLAVVDASCRLVAFLMMDGARHFSIITTQRKAITSASQRQPTGYAPEENALSMVVRMGDFTNVPGGFPIVVAGEVIGAVAAGGAKIEQDVEVAKAALAALTSA